MPEFQVCYQKIVRLYGTSENEKLTSWKKSTKNIFGVKTFSSIGRYFKSISKQKANNKFI